MVGEFQRALCDLIASPEFCIRVRAEGAAALGAYELTERERRRITAVVWQPGMSVTCTLYRANRITPLYSMLPRTCLLLGERLAKEASTFWLSRATDIRFASEVENFADFLKQRLVGGEVRDPYLREVVDFELSVNALQLAPRLRLLADLKKRPIGDTWETHPMLRVVHFTHEPRSLLEGLAAGQVPSGEPERGDFHLLLDGRAPTLDARLIDLRLAELLIEARSGKAFPANRSEGLTALIDARILVPV